MDTVSRAQKAVRTRTFRKRWTEAVDAVRRRGLVVHEIKAGQARDPELAALDSMMATLTQLVDELHHDR